MDKKTITILKEVGLNDMEIKTYLTGLQTGSVLASRLAKITRVTRQHMYDILKSLESKGMVSTTGKKYNKRFLMEQPIQLKNILERKKRKISKLEEQIDLLDIELKTLNDASKVKPEIRFYDDIEGVKNIWEESLECSDKIILSIAPIKSVLDFLGKDFIDNYLEKRIKKGKIAKALRVKAKEVFRDKWLTEHKKEKRMVRYLPENISISSTFLIYDDKVSIISSKKEGFGFTLKSEELAESMKGIFEALWRNASDKK